ncbi:MAG: tRNA (adenosine(37)-N6)-dimethylallyltransferase MiaA [Lentisphaeria bacterium]
MDPFASAAIPCVCVIGPTATGKTRLGVALARRFAGDILSLDSRQLFRGLDLGTGKDLAEYGAGAGAVPHHLIDIAAPDEEFHLFRFLELARSALADIRARGRLPVAVGGTPLYLKALLDGYALEGDGPAPERRREWEACSDDALLALLRDTAPELYARTDRTQRRRILRALDIAFSRQPDRPAPGPALDCRFLLLAPYYPRQEIHRRIAERLQARLDAGLVEEVAGLQRAGLSWERLDFFGLEYRWISRFLRGELSRQAMHDGLLAAIRQFCRRQDIWYRKLEREGHAIYWLPAGDPAAAAGLVESFLAGQPLPPPAFRLEDIRYGPRSDGQKSRREKATPPTTRKITV